MTSYPNYDVINEISVNLTIGPFWTKSISDDVIILEMKWFIWLILTGNELRCPVLIRVSGFLFQFWRKKLFLILFKKWKFLNRSNFFCGDLRCLICFLKDAETFKLSLNKVSRWRHVEAGLISSLFSEKYDFWSKFMVFQKFFFA